MAGDDGRDPESSGAQRKRRRRRKRVKRERSEFERREIVSIVCSYVCREGLTPPQEYSLRRLIKEERYPWLHEISVVQTGVSEDVAYRGARLITHLPSIVGAGANW